MHKLYGEELDYQIWTSSIFPHFETKISVVLNTHFNIHLPQFQRQLPLWILWRIWKSRNELLFRRSSNQWQQNLRIAIVDTQEWNSTLPVTSMQQMSKAHLRHHNGLKWTSPNPDYIKCNYDCSFSTIGLSSGAWILRDSEGFYREAGKSMGRQCDSVLEAELQALIMAMQQAWIRRYRKLVFEGDNRTAYNLLTIQEKYFGVHNWISDALFWKSKFDDVQFNWVPRNCNQAVDRLAKGAMPISLTFLSFFYVPPFLVSILHEDYDSVLFN